MRLIARFALVSAMATTISACAPSIDLTGALRVDDLRTGWLDAGYADGVNKITPTVSLTLTNASAASLGPLHVNAVFRRSGQASEWSARFVPVAGSAGLPPGKSTTLVLTSDRGYTSFDPVEDMLVNSQFVDAEVDVFARYGSSQWTRLAKYQVQRQLVGH